MPRVVATTVNFEPLVPGGCLIHIFGSSGALKMRVSTRFAILMLAVLGIGEMAHAQFVPTQPGVGRPGSSFFVTPTKPRELSFFSNRDIRAVAKDGDIYTMIGVADEVTTIFRNTARWSPDGSRLLYADTVFGTHALVSVDSNGFNRQVHLLYFAVAQFIRRNNFLHTGSNLIFENADWSPDGQFIVFNTGVSYFNRSGFHQRLFAVRVSDGTMFQITDDYPDVDANPPHYNHLQPRWSRVLNKLLFVRTIIGSNDFDNELWSINPDGTGRQRMLGSIFQNGQGLIIDQANAAWANNSSRVAFTSFGNLVIANATPSSLSGFTIYNRPDPVLQPSWSPDDTEVVQRKLLLTLDRIVRFNLSNGNEINIAETPWQVTILLNPDWRKLPFGR